MILFLCKVKKSQIHGDGKMSVSRGWEEVIAGWGWSSNVWRRKDECFLELGGGDCWMGMEFMNHADVLAFDSGDGVWYFQCTKHP